jgi:chromosome segregation ATPase
MEKNAMRREQDAIKLHHAELEEVRKSVFELSNSVRAEDIERKFKDRAHEEQRLSLGFQDMRTSVDEITSQNKDMAQSLKALEEARRQDAKRLADLQGELASVRKRADEAREKTTVHGDALHNAENRIRELLETETARQDAQKAYLAEQSLAQVDRDRAWKDWQATYELFKQQAGTMETQLVTLDDSIRNAKHAQESYNDLNQKLERRIAEVGEMQRLAEDRVRQEWVAFKADEQKRWTGHSLSQEESVRDLRKALDKIEGRVTTLDDASQTMQDQLHQTTDTTEKQLQELMNLAHDWLSAYERIMGHAKTKVKKTSR